MMNEILVIENDLSDFDKIKKGLEPVYKIVPEDNFAIELFGNSSNLWIEIRRLLDEHKRNLIGIVLDANLQDHFGISDNTSGIDDILLAIRKKRGLFSIIPIIVFTKFSGLERNALDKRANYFVEKQGDLEKQVKTEIRWILSSLVGIYQITKKRLEQQAYDFSIKEMVNDFQKKIDIILGSTNNINEIISKIYNRVEDVDKKMEMAVYSILSLMPEKKAKVIDGIINEIESANIAEIRNKLDELRRENRWEAFKEKLRELTLKEIPYALLVEFGTIGLKMLAGVAIRHFSSF